MHTILPSDFKRGTVLMLEGAPHVMEEMHTTGTAQTRHKIHARLRHLRTGHMIDRIFGENERVEIAPLESHTVTYSYSRGDTHVFIDAKTFDEFELSGERLGERRCFLKENEEYKVLLLERKLLDIVFPPDVPLKVVETAPPIRGGFDSTWKEATLETGIHIQVPLFVAKGETIRVDTLTRKYAGRHAGGK